MPTQQVEQKRPLQISTLIELGYVSEDQLGGIQQQAEAAGMDPLNLMYQQRIITEAQLHHAYAREHAWDFIDLSALQGGADIPPEILSLVPAPFARKHFVLPVERTADSLKLATLTPNDIDLINKIKGIISGLRIDLAYAVPSEIKKAVSSVYSATSEATSVIRHSRQRAEAASATAGGDLGLVLGRETGNVKAVDLIIEQAILDGASDIHIQPERDSVQVRYRIDGVLVTQTRVDKEAHGGIVNRIKVLAHLSTDNSRTPQDGRISDIGPGRDISLRVAVLPTSQGERVTMRVLDNKKAAEPLASLGFTEYNLDRYRRAFTQPSGLVLITGPTGSGKSTTLYSTFHELLTGTKNFMTVEDPVEYQIPGVSQIEINEAQDLDFASVMKSFKRSDPDVILLGEIRDSETAKLGLDIALTGHLLFSTIHADDAPGGISSLLKQDVNPFLVGAALDCVVAQRLLRRVCPLCSTVGDATPDEVKLLNLKSSVRLEGIRRANPDGCEACRHQGYKGRFAVHEVLLMDEKLKDLAARGNATPGELTKAARDGGMEPMLRDGIRRVMAGDTTIEEIARTIKTSQLVDIELG